MRVAIIILSVALAATFSAVRADESFVQVTLDSGPGYIVSETYAENHKDDLIASVPGVVKIDGFWTPTETNAATTDRILREKIEDGVKNPAALFPILRRHRPRVGRFAPQGEDGVDADGK